MATTSRYTTILNTKDTLEVNGHLSLSVKLDKERGKVHGERDRAIQLQSLIITIISINFDYFYLESAPAGSQVDFQVQAVTGHINPITSGPIAGEGYYNFTGQSSDWSNTKTVTINYGSNSTVSSTSTNQTISPPPTPTHPISEFSTWIILPLFAVIMLLSIVFARKGPLK